MPPADPPRVVAAPPRCWRENTKNPSSRQFQGFVRKCLERGCSSPSSKRGETEELQSVVTGENGRGRLRRHQPGDSWAPPPRGALKFPNFSETSVAPKATPGPNFFSKFCRKAALSKGPRAGSSEIDAPATAGGNEHGGLERIQIRRH